MRKLMITGLLLFFISSLIIAGLLVYPLFKNMVLVDQTTEKKLIDTIEEESLDTSVRIEELAGGEIPLERRSEGYDLDTGDIAAAKEMLLTADGDLIDDQRLSDDDQCINVHVLFDDNNLPEMIIKGNEVFYAQNGKLGELKGVFSNPDVSGVRYASSLNDSYFFMIASSSQHQEVYTILWQVDRKTLMKEQLAEDMYFTFSRPPMLFQPEGFEGYVMVYYTEDFHWGFGGDSSRPKYSYVRIYNQEYPQGKTLARFGFKAGTIVDVKWQDNSLIVTGDPNRPTGVDDEARPARIWKIDF